MRSRSKMSSKDLVELSGNKYMLYHTERFCMLYLPQIKGRARYAGFLLATTKGFGRGRGLFWPLGKNFFFVYKKK